MVEPIESQQTETPLNHECSEQEQGENLHASFFSYPRIGLGTALKTTALICVALGLREHMSETVEYRVKHYETIGSVDERLDDFGVKLAIHQNLGERDADWKLFNTAGFYDEVHGFLRDVVQHDFMSGPSEKVADVFWQLLRDTQKEYGHWYDRYEVYDYIAEESLLTCSLNEEQYQKHYAAYLEATNAWELSLGDFKSQLLGKVSSSLDPERGEVLAYTEQDWQERYEKHKVTLASMAISYEHFTFVLDSLRFFHRELYEKHDDRLVPLADATSFAKRVAVTEGSISDYLNSEENALSRSVAIDLFESYFTEVLLNHDRLFEQYQVTAEELKSVVDQAIHDARVEPRLAQERRNATVSALYGVAITFLTVWTVLPRFINRKRSAADVQQESMEN